MIRLSIVIVAYKAKKQLTTCLASIPKNKEYEVIVVDNNTVNRGFGAGCNTGVARSRGTYVLFLNPDCVVTKASLETLMKTLERDTTVGIVAPQLVGTDGEAYLSYSRQPTKTSTPIVYSFLNTLFPKNPITRKHWFGGDSLDVHKKVGIASGAALMMRRADFNTLGGFDEHFFMYWEEVDLCRRMIALGKAVLYVPKAQIVHERAASTPKKSGEVTAWFRASRWWFFKKHFGIVYALLVESWLVAQEEWRLLLIILLAAFLRFDRLSSLMPILGDQGRDFLAALTALKERHLPLLGIPSSMPRFKQGPVAVWLWMAVFGLFGVDPVAAGLVAAVVGLVAVAGVYLLAEKWWGRRAALVASLLLATAPLAVTQSRLAFHTNPIPLAAVLYLWTLVRKPVNGKKLAVAGLAFALLFQFELAHFPLLLLWLSIAWPLIRLKNWKAVGLGVSGLVVGLWPQIAYDFTHRFTQLGLFVGWAGYRLLAFLKPGGSHAVSISQLGAAAAPIAEYWQKFWSWGYVGVALVVTIVVVATVGYWAIHLRRFIRQPITMVMLWVVITMLAYLVHGGPSEAYFPSLFVPLVLILGWAAKRIPALLLLALVLSGLNSWFLYSRDYLVASPKVALLKPEARYGPGLATQREIVAVMMRLGGGKPLNLVAIGPGDEFESTLDNYQFLLLANHYPTIGAEAQTLYVLTGWAAEKPPLIDAAVYYVGGLALGKKL